MTHRVIWNVSQAHTRTGTLMTEFSLTRFSEPSVVKLCPQKSNPVLVFTMEVLELKSPDPSYSCVIGPVITLDSGKRMVMIEKMNRPSMTLRR